MVTRFWIVSTHAPVPGATPHSAVVKAQAMVSTHAPVPGATSFGG